jgi:hypothetical protein
MMEFSRVSDGIRLHHASHRHDGYDGDDELGPATSAPFVTDAAGGGALDHGPGPFAGLGPHPAGANSPHHDSGPVQSEHPTTSGIGTAGHVANHTGASLDSSATKPDSGASHPGMGTPTAESGANTAGNGGDGYFYGGIVHASLLIYEPINISVSLGYGSVALANQSNDLSVDQSAFQMAGVGGHGGSDNIASGGSVSTFSGSGVITSGDNGAGNGGSGYFSGALVDAPVVIYHPINIAVASSGGTAHASQSNTVDIDQSATQIAGVGGSGGNGNAAFGSIITLDPSWGSSNGASAWDVQTGGSQAGNGGEGAFYGSLVHTSFVVYDPINIAVAGYSSNVHSVQTNDAYVDQSIAQIAGIGGHGGNGNAAAAGHASLLSHGLWGGSDTIATGSNGAGNGGNGYFAGSLIDVSVAIYAPINIAIAGPHSTAVADQVNNVHIDQSAVQIAGLGGDGGYGNLALGGDLSTHLSDVHLLA